MADGWSREDLNLGMLAGIASWTPPSATATVESYAVFLAESAEGASQEFTIFVVFCRSVFLFWEVQVKSETILDPGFG